MVVGKSCATWITLGVAVIGLAQSAQAALLNLTQQAPDITSGLIKVNYTAATATFTATGSSASFDLDGIAPPDYQGANFTPGAFNLSMTVNTATGAPTGGTVSIGGKVTALGATSGTLLTGNISAFGFQTGGGQLFEFLINVTGGDLASYWNATGHPGGIILSAVPGTGAVPFTGSFTSDFRSTSGAIGAGVSDSFITPEPASLAIAFISTGILGARLPTGRNRQRHRPRT